ncbi:ribose-phosphate diphosphokinase [Candidatus Roizmanbacteria bacterium]|nr:ribose-phosphate diphosphokinase [Candidatus Roizmanbacteria bacterium]
MQFKDRIEAGQQLAQALKTYQGQDVVVYALPRGGVVIALEIAKFLNAPLDLIIVRKIGHPSQPEYALAAVSDNDMIGNQEELKSIDEKWLKEEVEKERLEIKRRRNNYLHDRKEISTEGKIAIIVDDGVATGLTMRAGIRELKNRHPQKIIVAVPVVPQSTAQILQKEAGALVTLDTPRDEEFLGAVGSYYEDFPQIKDEEVIAILKSYDKQIIDPLLFTFSSHQFMVNELAKNPNIKNSEFILKKFPNDELHINLGSNPAGQESIILGTITPPETNLFAFLLLAHTLKKESAQKVTALLPYLAYSRHDKKEDLKSYATELIGSLFSASYIDEIITVDIHSPQSINLFPIPITSISPAKLFAEEVKKLNLQDLTFVAPDEGAINRTTAVAKELGKEITYIVKTRTEAGVTHSEIQGKTGKKVIIIDDILDTGKTLISACEKLKVNGTDEIYIMITHGLFTGNEWEKLWTLNVKHIYCTDTIPLLENIKTEKITVLSAIPLIAEALQK